ncbi:MAG: fibronectin type III domain-containing protein, partial [Limisphaerales bacterium]
ETNHFVPQHVVEVVGRVFNAEGVALSDEFLLSAADSVCAQPMVAAVPAGGFVAAWSQLDGVNSTNSWDIYVRSFAANQQPLSAPVRVNNFLPGDQYGPKLAVYSNNVLAVWTSMGQDGSYEGVYGRFLTAAGALSGSEFRVNSTTVHKQINPSVASDGNSRFLVVWSSFIGGPSSFDLFAQRYVSSTGLNLLYAPDAPFVTALGSAAISATWPELAGYSVAFYELHVSGLTAPVVVSNIHATVTGLLPATTYSARLLYELTDGRRSALSSPAYVKTWGQDLNGDGLPDDWQTLIWGENPANWPDPMADSDGDGASNFAEFLAGTNPLSAASVLKTRLHRGPEGFRFSWNTTPGFVYQVQSGVGLDSWQNVGSPRFAHATFDSIQITPGSGAAFYRVIRLR